MQPELNWCQQDYSRVCVCMTDRTDLVLIASTFPGCSIYLCISGNRPIKSDVLYLGSPSPTPKQKWLEAKSITHARRGESQILTKAKGSPKSPGFHLSKNELKNFTIVCDNLAEMTISQFNFFFSDQNNRLDGGMLLPQLLWSYKIGIAEIIPEFGLWCRKLVCFLQSKMRHILLSLSHYHLL